MPPCEPTVIVCGMPQARIGDQALCAAGGPAQIITGSATVFVGGSPAARIGDSTSHGGVIVTGAPTVLIGDAGGGGAGGGGAAAPASEAARREQARNSFSTQEQGNSCVIATSRNIIRYYTGQDIPESQLRDEMREIMNDPDHDFNTQPINPAYARELLRRHGVENQQRRNQSLDNLEEMVSDNDPVLIGFRNPGHRVALSGVERDEDGNRTFIVMDPAGTYGGRPRRMSESDFNSRYNPNAIVIEPE